MKIIGDQMLALAETDEFLDNISDVWSLFMEQGHENLNVWKGLADLETAKLLLSDLGVPGETVTSQLVWIANRWLKVTSHTLNCVCMQCAAARKIKRLRLENNPK